MSAPKFAPKLARWFANDLVITAAVHAAAPATSGESSGQQPRSVRAVAGKHLMQRRGMSAQRLAQQQGSVPAIATEVRLAVRLADTQHPMNHPRNFRCGNRATAMHRLRNGTRNKCA